MLGSSGFTWLGLKSGLVEVVDGSEIAAQVRLHFTELFKWKCTLIHGSGYVVQGNGQINVFWDKVPGCYLQKKDCYENHIIAIILKLYKYNSMWPYFE